MKADRVHSQRSPWPLLALAAVSLGLAAGISCYQAFTPVKWTHHSETLRCIAKDPSADPQERIDAIVTMQRNARAAIECLRGLECEPSPIAKHAQNALSSIAVSLQR